MFLTQLIRVLLHLHLFEIIFLCLCNLLSLLFFYGSHQLGLPFFSTNYMEGLLCIFKAIAFLARCLRFGRFCLFRYNFNLWLYIGDILCLDRLVDFYELFFWAFRTLHFNLILQCYLYSEFADLFELIGMRNPFNLTYTFQTFIFTLVLKFRQS